MLRNTTDVEHKTVSYTHLYNVFHVRTSYFKNRNYCICIMDYMEQDNGIAIIMCSYN